MPIAVIAFDFDPLLRLADGIAVRWQAVALVVIIFAGLLMTGLIARRNGLRLDDLLFIAVAIVPGAVIGGRLGYVLLHVDYYAANPGAITDPGQGSLELALGVVGGVLSASYVAALLGAPIGPWLRTVALPLLLVLGAGKLAMVLGGAGQGQPSDLAWATAYVAPGPWGSLAPALASHPSQAYEGLATLAIAIILILVLAADGFEARDGRLFVVVLGAWAAARAITSLTWRDPSVAGGLSAGGLIAGALALGSLVVLASPAGRQPTATDTGSAATDVAWADPEARPRF